MDSTSVVTRAVADFAATHLDGPATPVCVGLSGGPDSLALAACAVRAGLDVTALVVDHGLQRGSAAVAARAADAARRLGAQARVLPVEVGSRGGLEAAARAARYEALDAAREGRPVLLGHTADDQAETVLLGLARGSGARSIAGMRPWREPWGGSLLGVRRVRTLAVCTELGLEVHHDPHNRYLGHPRAAALGGDPAARRRPAGRGRRRPRPTPRRCRTISTRSTGGPTTSRRPRSDPTASSAFHCTTRRSRSAPGSSASGCARSGRPSRPSG